LLKNTILKNYFCGVRMEIVPWAELLRTSSAKTYSLYMFSSVIVIFFFQNLRKGESGGFGK